MQHFQLANGACILVTGQHVVYHIEALANGVPVGFEELDSCSQMPMLRFQCLLWYTAKCGNSTVMLELYVHLA